MRAAAKERQEAIESEMKRKLMVKALREASERRAEELRKREIRDMHEHKPTQHQQLQMKQKLTPEEEAFVRKTLSSPKPKHVHLRIVHSGKATSHVTEQSGAEPATSAAAARQEAHRPAEASTSRLQARHPAAGTPVAPPQAAARHPINHREAKAIPRGGPEEKAHGAREEGGESSSGLAWPKATLSLAWPHQATHSPDIRWPDGQSMKMTKHAAEMRPTSLQVGLICVGWRGQSAWVPHKSIKLSACALFQVLPSQSTKCKKNLSLI